MQKNEFQQFAPAIPEHPGIYRFYDKNNTIIYVGKAKNLKKRISSYFSNFEHHTQKTKELIFHIHYFEWTITHSDHDAFLLENTLIKTHQPRYNINLKDDKTYPFIAIKNEPFPRIVITRKKTNDNKEYLGPYTSIFKIRELLSFIRSQIPLRTCTLDLSNKKILSQCYKKPCLEYHIGNCKAPCMNWQTAEDYQANIVRVKKILSGNVKPIVDEYKILMHEHAHRLEFEKAQIYKKKIEELQRFQSKSIIVQHKDINVDVFACIKNKNIIWVNYVMVKEGSVLQSEIFKFTNPLDEDLSTLLPAIILDIRTKLKSNNLEIITPFEVPYEEENIMILVPRSGIKKQLLAWAFQNIEAHEKSMHLQTNIQNHTDAIMMETLQHMQTLLHLPVLPLHIECFDNSHFQGTAQVSAMVCFKNGIPSKKDYRTFHIKSTSAINDFKSMEEAVYRRYKKLQDQQEPSPQLIIIDGGKGQLSAALNALKTLNLQQQIPIISLAKNIEEIFFPNDQQSIILPFDSDVLQLIRKMRDEIHRFVITFHRKTFLKKFQSSELDHINNIGQKTKELLLQHFKSVAHIKEASENELVQLIGKSKTKILKAYFK